MNILAEIKLDNEEAAGWLLYYPIRRRQYYQDRLEALGGTRSPEIRVKSGPGNPTMQKALKLSALDDVGCWLEAIELVESVLGEKKLAFLRVRREAAYLQERFVRGRPAWVVYTQHQYADEMAKKYQSQPEKFWISERTLKTWWQEIVDLTVRIALKKDLLKNNKVQHFNQVIP